ncbi:hypothetical protein LCGC14_1147920 [marine sediment metagenome]|uniref:Uncharacterized protein n=1 Tax=marine sediment metagenome TaxID=412755 RepID=A0A0F9LWD2_9ZZZZ
MPDFKESPQQEPDSYGCPTCHPNIVLNWSLERYIAHRKNFHRPLLLSMVGETKVEAVDGCIVGVRGKCTHGFNSWPVELDLDRRGNLPT